MEEEKDGEKQMKRSDSKRKPYEQSSTLAERGAKGSTGSSVNKEETEKTKARTCVSQLLVFEPAEVSDPHRPVSQSASAVTAPIFPHLLHFTAEEITAPGIEDETFPEMGFIESRPESHSSLISLTPSPRCLKSDRELREPQTAAVPPQKLMAHCYSGFCNGPSKASVKPLSYRTPDFSQVEPRVRFPKGSYKPPKSRRSPKRESLSPPLPIVFKSPADIVKEVLLNTTDGSPVPSDSNRTLISAPNSTVPQEFRCRQQATTLLEQLQEDYNRLLTKYAEAENTIDRLRLEAKVNLYSDPPKPGHLMQSGLGRDASKAMTLDFPQAQRAEINSASLHPNGHGVNQGLQVGQQLAKILYNQADKFLQQTFEDFLQSGKLQPSEQMNGLSQLAEGLSSLERGYLLARDEHRLMQQRGAGVSHFDPERELEGLIYQCGLHMDELKEQMEQMRQEQPTCEAPPSPPPQPTPSSVPSEGGETLTQPQIPEALLVDPEGAAEMEVNSARRQSDEESAMDNEDILNSLYLRPLNGRYRCVEQDFDRQMDHYQSFKELPKMFDQKHSDMQPREDDKGRQGEETGHVQVQKSLPQRVKDKSGRQESPAGVSKQQTSRSSPPSRRDSSQSPLLTVHPPSGHQRLEMGKSHSSSLSSLGEITAAERRNSKLQNGSRRVLSQDGIISPETDSGFVGSESSHLTPAAAPSPLHQGASQSVTVHQEGSTGKHQTGPVSAPSPASSTSHSHTATEPRETPHLGPKQRYRSRERRRTFSCSPQRWVIQTEQTRVDSVASEFGLENDSTHTVSEEGHSDHYTESITSLHSSEASSSPTAWYHHGDSLRALGSRQVANRKEAIQTLQVEVNTLKERLESCLSNKPLNPMRAAPPAQVTNTHHYTSTPRIRVRAGASASGVQMYSNIHCSSKRLPFTHKHCPQQENKPQTECVHHLGSVLLCLYKCLTEQMNLTAKAVNLLFVPNVHHVTEDDLNDQGVATESRPTLLTAVSVLSVDARRHTAALSQSVTETQTLPHTPAANTHSPLTEWPGADTLQLLLHCCSACQLYSLPLHMSPSNSTGTSSGVRGDEEVRGRLRRSLSTAKQPCLDSSLNRAIKAARHMKHTSRHMARSLAAGLQYHELLTQSYS
ncbi:hypothetical protein INR49_023390 [Caranx melampygus]|nr:hypothetical protein INR49_023390 [Caranx melampygus]